MVALVVWANASWCSEAFLDSYCYKHAKPAYDSKNTLPVETETKAPMSMLGSNGIEGIGDEGIFNGLVHRFPVIGSVGLCYTGTCMCYRPQIS